MEGLQVLDRARATEVERILADPDVARVVALPLRDMGEFVVDHRALTQRITPSGCLDLLAKPRLQPLVFRMATEARGRTRRWCTAGAPGSDRTRRDRIRRLCRTKRVARDPGGIQSCGRG